MDLDGCDGCSSGAFDVFDDGSDNDGDAVCDAGYEDDDNDGCTDDADAVPSEASADDDFDFLGSDCDNCPEVAKFGQAHVDAGTDDESSLPGVQHCGDACGLDLDNDGLWASLQPAAAPRQVTLTVPRTQSRCS